jgi:hypothetical protein
VLRLVGWDPKKRNVRKTPQICHRDQGASFNISSAISQSACAGLACAMGATIDGIALFYAVTKNPAPAMVAGWCDGLNCTFKTVKNMRPASYC